MNKSRLYNALFEKYGNVKRARNYYFYTEKGIRLTDLFQEDGHAVLGWSYGRSRLMFKNTMERGCTGSFISSSQNALKKAVNSLFQSQYETVFWCRNYEPYLKDFEKLREWKPFEEVKASEDVFFVAPFPFADSGYIVAVSEKYDAEESAAPALLNGIVRSVYDLAGEIPLRTEENWCSYDSVLKLYWNRKGAYLFPKVPESEYDDFCLHCLDMGLVISPSFKTPSIVPFDVNIGDFSKLKNNPFKF